MFRGTICKVEPMDYLLRKLNDELTPEVAAAEEAEAAIIGAIMAMMRLLTWQDFELLVDLVFSASGWRRVGRQREAANVVAIGPERMAQMVLDAGLFNWLKDKVS